MSTTPDPTAIAAYWPYSGRCYCKREAGYIWTTQPALNDVPLCEEHCAAWRADVAAGTCNEPLRIRTVAAATVCPIPTTSEPS